MPAPPSSLIDPALGHLVQLAAGAAGEQQRLPGVLAQVADPRHRRGVRHRLTGILGLALCAVVAGARSFTAIAEWAADADGQTLRMLGVTGRVPSESTFRRTLQRLDAGAFDDLAGAWAQQATLPGPAGRRVIAVNGKTLRGSASGGDPGDHLLAALDHAHGAVLGQAEVGAKTNEIPMLPLLLDRTGITGAVITADAMHAQRGHATYLAGRGAHYLLTVKRNQPGLHDQLAALPWRQVPVADDTRQRGHGRDERRILKVTAVTAGLAFPHAAHAIQIVRRRRTSGKKKWSRETVYAVTSLTAIQVDQQVVQALAPQRSCIPLGKRIRPGDGTGVLVIRTPVPASTSSKTAVNLLSRSRIRNLNRAARSPRPISRLRACWAVHSPVGWAVTPRMCTRRVPISITKDTCRRPRNTVPACRKSHARIPDAWEVRNCRQVGDTRRGAGVRPASARIRRIVPSPVRCPGPGSSPWMRRCPQRGFRLATCRTSSRISSGTGGRPVVFG
jgi:predicted transposase YbfD/YdcC